jgi:hypothetical protein
MLKETFEKALKTNKLTFKMDPITFILLDGSTTTKDVCVSVDGVDTTQFEKNPVMFYQHNDWNMPVGRWANVRKDNGQLLADAIFDTEDTDKDVQRMIKKVQNGFINMASCGLVDLECSDDPMLCGDGACCMVVTNCRLREASIVAVGGNHNSMALRFYDNEGQEITFGKKENAALKLSDFIVKQKIEIMSKTYLKTLNLADNADDVAIGIAVEKLANEKAAADAKVLLLTDQVNAHETAKTNARKAEALNLTDAAIRDGRLDAKAKESTLNLFDKDFDGTKVLLESIPKQVKLSDLELGDKDAKERKELEAMTYSDIDKKGKVLFLRDTYPDLYKEKYKAQFGVEPKMPK